MTDTLEVPISEALFADREAMADAAAAFIAGNLLQGLTVRGRAGLIVTGGRTPGGIYDRLARTAIAWPQVTLTLSDERFVPPDHPDSNEGLIRNRLLQYAAASATFIPLMGKGETVETVAAQADRGLSALRWPADLTVLGMGDDGHIASLFPESPVLANGLAKRAYRRCIAVPAGMPAPQQPRLSLTLKALTNTRAILIVTTGKAKRSVFDAARHGDADSLPIAHLLRRSRAPIHFFWAP